MPPSEVVPVRVARRGPRGGQPRRSFEATSPRSASWRHANAGGVPPARRPSAGFTCAVRRARLTEMTNPGLEMAQLPGVRPMMHVCAIARGGVGARNRRVYATTTCRGPPRSIGSTGPRRVVVLRITPLPVHRHASRSSGDDRISRSRMRRGPPGATASPAPHRVTVLEGSPSLSHHDPSRGAGSDRIPPTSSRGGAHDPVACPRPHRGLVSRIQSDPLLHIPSRSTRSRRIGPTSSRSRRGDPIGSPRSHRMEEPWIRPPPPHHIGCRSGQGPPGGDPTPVEARSRQRRARRWLGPCHPKLTISP